MSARVNIEVEAWGDVRFAVLARACSFADAHHALIKCARVWAWQTANYTPDAPTYVVPREIIEIELGERGPDALLRARLAVEEPAGFRMRGSEGRIEWLYALRAAGQRGSEAARRKRDNKEVPAGRPQGNPQGATTHPATLTPLTPALALTPVQQISDSPTHAGAIPPSTGELEARARGALAVATWKRLSDLRVAIAKELGLAGVMPFPAITPGSHSAGFRELQSRIREEGSNAQAVCDRVLEVLAAQARDTKSIDWLSEKSFTEGGWRTAREAIPGWRAAPRGDPPKKRGEAIGAASPRTDHPVSDRPIPIGEL
jgi:hypothetical protein